MQRLFYASLLLLAAGNPARALVGDWLSFTRLTDIRDLQALDGELWAATAGGVRRIPLDKTPETAFRNTEGLQDVSIQSLIATPQKELWAVAESGLLYRLNRARTRWDMFGTAYKSAGWTMRPRAVLYRAPYLILGSAKGLSFYHTGKAVADANITRMGGAKSVSVNAVAMVDDTLFAGTDKGIFRSVLRMDRLLTDPQVNIFNPEIWTLVPGTAGVLFHPPGGRDTAGTDGDGGEVPAEDSLTVLPPEAVQDYAHGLLYYTGKGIASEYEGALAGNGSRVARYGRMVLGGKEYPNETLHMKALENLGGRWFMGNPWGLYEYLPEWNAFYEIRNPNDLPAQAISHIQAGRHGVYAWASPLIYKYSGGAWQPLPDSTLINDHVDATRRGSHPFHVLGEDTLYLGSWGYGFYSYAGGKTRNYRSGDGTNCLATADERAPAYAVIIAQAPYRGKEGVFLATFHAAKPYRLAYLDNATGSITCLDVEARDNELLSLEIIGEDLLVAVTEGGLAAHRIRNRDGRVSLDPANLAIGLRAPEPVKSGLSDRMGNFWVTSGSGKMFYLPRVGDGKLDSTGFMSLEGFPAQECKSIDRDARGHIWVGCVMGGVVEITPGRDSLSHSFRRYGVNDGLLSENIYHLSVDSSTGHVWVVTDRGVTRLESSSRPAARKLGAARVYPNPFLARHSQVVFDGLATDSEIQVLTPGGSVLFHRRLQPSDGGQLRWDGRNQSGRKVTEGIYFYVIRSPHDLKRGKLIVGR